MKETRTCTHCKGSGKNTFYADKPCRCCEGTGSFEAPDLKGIVEGIVSTRGKNKGRLLKSKPRVDHKTAHGNRVYFVWRLARFHGGQDVRMPVMAYADIGGDPFSKELEALAEAVARRAFGTDRAAAYRWVGALGHNVDVPEGQPLTAYPNGPEFLS